MIYEWNNTDIISLFMFIKVDWIFENNLHLSIDKDVIS